jgi:hypothetical protein
MNTHQVFENTISLIFSILLSTLIMACYHHLVEHPGSTQEDQSSSAVEIYGRFQDHVCLPGKKKDRIKENFINEQFW